MAAECTRGRTVHKPHNIYVWGEAPHESRGVWNKPLHCKVSETRCRGEGGGGVLKPVFPPATGDSPKCSEICLDSVTLFLAYFFALTALPAS